MNRIHKLFLVITLLAPFVVTSPHAFSETHLSTRIEDAGQHRRQGDRLVRQSEEAGWVPVRLELMTGTYHYLAILAQQEIFPPEPKKKKKDSSDSKSTET